MLQNLHSQKEHPLKSLMDKQTPRRETSFAETIVQLDDVSVNFGNIQALKNVNFALEKGEVLFVTGASGAGKTTLLRVLAGDLIPNSGKVRRHSTAFVAEIFQDLRLMADKTCRENLEIVYDAKIYQNKEAFRRDMGDLCRILGIEDRLDLKIQNTNGGLKQKVAIVRALLSRPDILIADEPTSSLDYENSRKFFEVLNYYNSKKGLTVIWASHNKELIKKFTGRIVHIDKGRLVYSGHACFI
jgi:ABC-type multidrug transport system ATPase subunit